MATPVDKASEQVKFLVTCIKYTEGGKPDWQKVADEMGIVSKAAAAKRYERLLKQHGMNASGQPIGNKSPVKNGGGASEAEGEDAPKTPKSTAKRGKNAADDGESPTKKRKTPAKVEKEVRDEEVEMGEDDGEAM